jgi:hypothetical protein
VTPRRGGQRSGRVGGDELDLDPLVAAAAAEVITGPQDVVDRGQVPGVGQEQVEEAGAGDLDLLDTVGQPLLQRRAEALGDRARRLSQRRRKQHRRVRRVVAEPGLLRPLEAEPVAGGAAVAQLAGGGDHGGLEVVEWCGTHGDR